MQHNITGLNFFITYHRLRHADNGRILLWRSGDTSMLS